MLKRLLDQVRQFLGLAAPENPQAPPEATLAAQQEALGRQLAHFNRSLAASAAYSSTLQEQVASLETRIASLQSALQTHSVIPGSEDAGAQLALELESAQNQIDALRVQRNQAQATFDQITHARNDAIQAAEKRLQELKGHLSEEQLRQALAQAIRHAGTRD